MCWNVCYIELVNCSELTYSDEQILKNSHFESQYRFRLCYANDDVLLYLYCVNVLVQI